jgi:carboxyl-terminal processing protease
LGTFAEDMKNSVLLTHMQTRLGKWLSGTAIVLAVLILLGSGYYAGFTAGKKQADTVVVEGATNTAGPSGEGDFGVFWQTWKLIQDTYLKNDQTSNQAKVYGAVKGLVESLKDPYSEFFDPVENQQFQEDVQGNFSGIGAEIGIRKEQLVVIAPLKGSPAEQAGLRAGDKIFAINASSTEGITIDEAVHLIRGAEGSKVTLNVFRDDWEKPKDIVITRATIEVPTLTYEMKADHIAYVSLNAFNANAPELFADAAQKIVAQGGKGMILDLRNDPGGYLDVAVNLAGYFLPKGDLVLSEESRIAPKQEDRSEGSASLGNIPLVILMNGGSASASEILAGALHDHGKATLVGEQSFGKGVVQQIMPLKNGASVKLTIAHWVLPNGQILEGAGIKPDVEVKLSEEDALAGKDPQLDKAIEVLKGKMR